MKSIRKINNENQIKTTLALKHAFWARAPGRILQRFCGGRRHRGSWGAGKTVVFARDAVFYSVFVGVGGIGDAGVQVKLLFLHEMPYFTAFWVAPWRPRDGLGATSGRPRGDLGAASGRPRWGLGKTAIFARDTVFYDVLVASKTRFGDTPPI